VFAGGALNYPVQVYHPAELDEQLRYSTVAFQERTPKMARIFT
jgi:hypothetical protein